MEVVDVEVSVTHGDVSDAAKQYATEKITQLARYTRRSIVYAALRLSVEPGKAIERPAVAEATLDFGGPIVRAHVAARDPIAAVDLLDDRLRRRLERQERRARNHHRSSAATDGWRHGDLPTQRPEYFDRAVEEREVVRHKTFALEPMTCDEAAWDLDMLGHDFYLFTDIETDTDAVISHHEDDGHLELQCAGAPAPLDGTVASIVVSTQTPPQLDLVAAQERLDASRERFVFFVNEATGRGNVVYRRYDGHYGLIDPA